MFDAQSRPDRRADRRADRRQHGRRPARRRIPSRAPRDLHGKRRGADFRRSDLRFPRQLRRRARRGSGVTPGSDVSRKDHRRRPPVGAYGGAADLMELVSPAGPVYQAGTLSGNPLAMTAGHLVPQPSEARLYRDLAALGRRLAAGLADAAREAGVALQVNAVGSLLTPFFTDQPCATTHPRRAQTPISTRNSSEACSRVASIPRPHSSRRGSFPPRIRRRTWIGRSWRHAGQ